MSTYLFIYISLSITTTENFVTWPATSSQPIYWRISLIVEYISTSIPFNKTAKNIIPKAYCLADEPNAMYVVNNVQKT